jgi:hypothetical protein
MHFLDGILMMNEFLATGKLTDSRKSLFRVSSGRNFASLTGLDSWGNRLKDVQEEEVVGDKKLLWCPRTRRRSCKCPRQDEEGVGVCFNLIFIGTSALG